MEIQMQIRKSTLSDIADILKVFDAAKIYMAAEGNTTQWVDGYPDRSIIEDDIAHGYSYVCEQNNRIIATFYFAPGPDPDYITMKEGAWLPDPRPYYVIHHIATDGTVKGTGSFCFQWAQNQVEHIRIDTHEDNITMQNILRKFGFVKTGKIDLSKGGERITFQWLQHSDKCHYS